MDRLDNKKIQKLRLNSLSKDGKHINVFNLAKELDISHKAITRMENDENYNPGVLTILKLSRYFNVSIDDLLVKD